MLVAVQGCNVPFLVAVFGNVSVKTMDHIYKRILDGLDLSSKFRPPYFREGSLGRAIEDVCVIFLSESMASGIIFSRPRLTLKPV